MGTETSFIDRVISSQYFKKAMEKAEAVFMHDKLGVLGLLQKSLIKVQELAESSNISIIKLLNHYIVLFVALIKSYIAGSYKKLPAITLVKIIAVLIYFISPFDFIPDVLPFVGFSDDLAVVLWVGKSIKNELDEFEKHTNV
jgi:uncharacterized membrane protein YkvA (DUF1232 family)